MRKNVGLLFLILLLSACSVKEKEIYENKEVDNNINEEIKEEYVDDNPIKLSLFLYDNNYHNKKRIEDTYYANFTSGVDIGSFEVFLTDESTIDGINFKDTWNKYYNNYVDITNYKIGYNIKFVLNDGTSYNSNYLEPDNYRYGEYFYTYLYDDIHQVDGAFYSHLENMEDNTLITSIKIYAVEGIDKVDYFVLSAFTYDGEEDFDGEGNYRGNSIYRVNIKRK